MTKEHHNFALEEMFAGIRRGERFWISRAISLVESSLPEDREKASALLSLLYKYTGSSVRIGVTGIPGVGKSTFIESLGTFLISEGLNVAVLTVDPSSKSTGGSLLGDKARMEQLSSSSNAYIRSSASGGSLGGVAGNTRNSILLCEAAGFDVVIVETVGVGQSETLVNDLTDLVVLLMVAGTGDEVQAIKKGVLEIGDFLVVNKSDGKMKKEAEKLKNDLISVKELLPRDRWRKEPPAIMTVSALEGTGISDCWKMIRERHEKEKISGKLNERRKEQQVALFDEVLKEKILEKIMGESSFGQDITEKRKQLLEGKCSIEEAVGQLLRNFYSNK